MTIERLEEALLNREPVKHTFEEPVDLLDLARRQDSEKAGERGHFPVK